MTREARVKKLVVFFIVLIVVALVAVVGHSLTWIFPMHDELVSRDENVRREWANLDAQLQRRYALVPNLVATAERSAEHEGDVYGDIANSYSGYQKARSINDRIEASYQVESGLRVLCGRPFPKLGSNQLYSKLMQSLSETEDRIASQRISYNKAVNEHNTLCRSIKGGVAATVFGIAEAQYYEPPEYAKVRPDVNFQDPMESRAAEKAAREAERRRTEAEAAAAQEAVEPPAVEPAQPRLTRRDIRFIGAMRTGNEHTAIVALPDGRNLSVKRGDRIPNSNLVVSKASPSGVSYREVAE